LTCLKSLIQKTLAAIDIFIKMSIANAPSKTTRKAYHFTGERVGWFKLW
jgi:hypothetical protein